MLHSFDLERPERGAARAGDVWGIWSQGPTTCREDQDLAVICVQQLQHSSINGCAPGVSATCLELDACAQGRSQLGDVCHTWIHTLGYGSAA